MSKMELRSSRSRSRTPFLVQEELESESIAGNHVEKTVVRTTRQTTVVRTNENASSSTDEINTTRETRSGRKSVGSTSKSDRSLRNRILKTSDYSSEDGENEVSSSKTIRQNQRNQLTEDARIVQNNGAEMPALELYRRSGRYWDVYPKTDWTYSQHSKDRVEIAPGVVAMPNMSRKTIHSLDESGVTRLDSSHSLYTENVAHKNVNTEDSYTSRYLSRSKENALNSRSKHNYEEYNVKRRTVTRWSSFKQVITSVFTTIFTVFYSTFRYTNKVQTSVFSQIHKIASKVMLWDTYLLWKTRPGEKARKLIWLCLLPLLLIGSAWLLSGLGGALYGVLLNSTESSSSMIPTFGFWEEKNEVNSIRSERDVNDGKPFDFAKRSSTQSDHNTVVEERIVKVTEKIYVEPPSAKDIASSFTKEQLEAIALAVKNFLNLGNEDQPELNSDKLVQKIINNPSFVNIINNQQHKRSNSEDGNKIHEDLLNKQQVLIDTLLKELDKMRGEIITNNKLRSEEYAKLSLDMRRCCNKRPIINVEGYVSRAVTDLINDPEFLKSQQGLNSWLHSLFMAKQDLENHFGNLTSKMDAKLAAVVESNSQQLMDNVAAKLVETTKETVIKREIRNVDDTMVKKIVKEALAVYDADRTGMVDYAMESMGGQVVTIRCTEPYHYGKAVVSVLGIPLWHRTNSPRTVITPTIAPGDCWAFQNFPGFIVVKLSNKIRVDAFSMEHISKLLLPEGKMDSAPKEFEVYGLKEENDRDPVLLGMYKYDDNGESLQFFLVEKDNQVFDMIEIRIVSNHGNPNYTCLYRFRVHGKLHHEEHR